MTQDNQTDQEQTQPIPIGTPVLEPVTPQPIVKPARIGRPPKYKTPEQMQEKINEYFETGIPERTKTVSRGKERHTVTTRTPTVSGLALYLGFVNRQSMQDYKAQPVFTVIVKRAIARLEVHYEEFLQTGHTVGAIFWLKNHGWADERKITHEAPDFASLIKNAQRAKRIGPTVVDSVSGRQVDVVNPTLQPGNAD